MKFEFIRKESENYNVKLLCKLLGVSRSGYYEFIKRLPSKRSLKHEWLTDEIKRVFDQHKGRYGSPRIAQQLYDEGIETNKRVVAMLMQRAGLVSIYSRNRRFKRTSKKGIVKENLLNRKFTSTVPGEIYVTDITYVPCSDGVLYLTVYLDLATRIPRSFGMTDHMRKECVTVPLKNLGAKGFTHEGTMIHSDQGSQYRSFDFAGVCNKYKLVHSMSCPGKPIDNAVAESFFKTVKTEVIRPNRHLTKAQMEVVLCNYLEDYYPKERIHTAFGMTPNAYEQWLVYNQGNLSISP